MRISLEIQRIHKGAQFERDDKPQNTRRTMFRGVADVSEVWRNLSIRSRGKHLRRCELLETAAKLSAAAKRSCTRKHIDVFAVVETATRELPNFPSSSTLCLSSHPIGRASSLQFLGDKVRSYATPVRMRNCARARHARAIRLRCRWLASPFSSVLRLLGFLLVRLL